jgi:ribonuclease P protein component
MLSFPNRLPKEKISLLLRYGTHVRSELIELIYKKRQIPDQVGDDNKKPRFAFIVSTKIDKRATQRNRMRRTMSESVWHLLSTIPPMDGIFIARKNFADLPQTEVEKIVSGLLPV